MRSGLGNYWWLSHQYLAHPDGHETIVRAGASLYIRDNSGAGGCFIFKGTRH